METDDMKPYYINEHPEVDRIYADRKTIEGTRGLTISDVMQQHERLMNTL